jgi:uncharacterized protein YejL (UPF0352 family)
LTTLVRGRKIQSMRSCAAVGIACCLLLNAAIASAQRGDVARKEAERRKTVKASGKTYTNDTLKSEPQPSSSTPAAADASAAPPSASPAPAPPRVSADPAERKKEESQWRDRIKGERDALERAKAFADAMQSRINALNTDFVNRDDPAQRNVVAADREKAVAEMERLKKEIAQHTKAIAGIQDEARRAGVPAGWVR